MVKGVLAVTGRVGIKIVGDRIHAVVTSGEASETFAIKFHEAEWTAREVLRQLAEHRSAPVVKLPRKGSPLPHG